MSSGTSPNSWELQVGVPLTDVFRFDNFHSARYEDVESVEGGSGDWHYLFTSCLELTVEVSETLSNFLNLVKEDLSNIC